MRSGRPRVVLVVDELRATGGQERTALELARGLAPDHDVHVVTARAEVGCDEAFTTHVVGRLPWPEAARFASFVFRAMSRCRSLHPDLIHGIGPNCPVADVVHLQTVNREKYRLLPELLPRAPARRAAFAVYRRVVEALERRALCRADALFVAVSRRVGEEAVRHYGVLPGRLRHVPNGVDLEHFRPPDPAERTAARRSLGIAGDARLALFVGPDLERKGLGTALEALASSRLATTRLLVVGGPKSGQASFRERARRVGVSDRVLWLAHGGDVRSACWAADLFLFPSRYDPFGMAAAEAMACGLPAVLSRVSGIVEYLPEGAALVVEDERDAGELAAAAAWLADPAQAAVLGGAGRKAVAQFAWPRVVEGVAAIYRERLGLTGPSASMASPYDRKR